MSMSITPSLTFDETIKSVLFENYCNFSTRARRSEYWYYVLFINIIEFILLFLISIFERGPLIIPAIFFFFFIYALIPLLPLAVRRLHDTGRSGWYLLLSLIPFGGIFVFVFLCEDSSPYSNIYGPSNKYIISNLVPLEDQINLVTQGNDVNPQGNIVYPQGNVVNPQTKVIFVQGNVAYPQGNVVYPQGNVVYPQGNIVIPQGNVVYTQGNVAYPQGNVVYPQGNIVIPQGNVVYTQGNGVPQGNFVIQPGNNNIQNPQNNVIYSNQDNNPIIDQNSINDTPGNVDNTPQN